MALITVFLASTLPVLIGTIDAKEPMPDSFAKALKVLLNEDVVSRENRKVVAKGLEVSCRELGEKIPELSPRENDWVDREIKAGRIEALYDTVEFAKRQSRITLVKCYTTAQLLVRDLPEIREVAYWSELLGAVVDENLINHIRNLRKSKAGNISDLDTSFVSLFPLGARLIVDGILTPSLKRLAAQPN